MADSRTRKTGVEPQIVDYVLAAGAVAMLAGMLTAIARGYPEWGLLHWPIWAHLATLAIALSLTPIMLVRQRGDLWHRRMGYVWLACMVVTSLVSFLVPPPGTLSPIFILSILTLAISFRVWQTARAHQWKQHRTNVRGIVIGGLLLAGFMTFQFGRLFDRWIHGLAGTTIG
ncbi:hypothetical protein [Alteriqipengyuania sp.]|uniref:hypothetical protein n=1 Tax=Alteriqipengyuania sp. TaxID=2800692 RepID=UPI0035190613